MAAEDPPAALPDPPPLPPPRIYEATLGANGAVVRVAEIARHVAEAMRRVGLNVVVCGGDKDANERLAAAIERTANGYSTRHRPHQSAGRHALPHHQPASRSPAGHTFYETANRKAF